MMSLGSTLDESTNPVEEELDESQCFSGQSVLSGCCRMPWKASSTSIADEGVVYDPKGIRTHSDIPKWRVPPLNTRDPCYTHPMEREPIQFYSAS
jgi:hypothetical protein